MSDTPQTPKGRLAQQGPQNVAPGSIYDTFLHPPPAAPAAPESGEVIAGATAEPEPDGDA